MEEELEIMYPGTVEGVGQLSVVEKESTIPHFTLTRQDGTSVQIMIQKNRYMPGEKNSLTKEECKRLNEWAHNNEKKEWWNRGGPNWDHVISCWNGLYNDYELYYDDGYLERIPDYTIIHH